MHDKPLISIICCTHNRLQFVRDHLEVVKGQLGSAVELIYALDHCDDGTREFLEAAKAQGVQLQIHENDGDRGLFNCRNFGMRHARGSYIHFLDDDDSVEPGFYAQAVASLGAAQEAADLYMSRLMICEPDGRRYDKPVFSPHWEAQAEKNGDEWRLRGDLFLAMLNGQIYFNGANTLYRRELLDRYGFRKELKKSADWLFCLEASLLGELRIVHNRAMTANYVLHPASMSLSPDKQSWNAKMFDILLQLAQTHGRHLEPITHNCAMAHFHAGYSNRHLDRAKAWAHYRRAFALGLRRQSALAALKLALRL